MPVTIEDVLDAPGPERQSARELAGVARGAVRIVWAAAPRQLGLLAAAQLTTAIASAGQVLLAAKAAAAAAATARDGSPADHLVAWLVAFALVSAVAGFLAAAQQEASYLLGEQVRRYATDQVLDAATRVELVNFDRSEFHDRLMRARYTAEIHPKELAAGLITATGSVASSIGMGVALFVLSPILGLLVLVAAFPLWFTMSRSSKAQYRFAYKMTSSDRERFYVNDVLTGKDTAHEVRAYGLPGMLRQRFNDLYDARLQAVRRLVRSRLRVSLVASLVSAVAFAGLIGVTLWLASTHHLSLSDAGAAVVAVLLLVPRLGGMSVGIAAMYESALFVSDFHRFLADTPVPPTNRPAPAAFDELVATDVRFRYPGAAADSLRGVSVRLRRGEVIALVGENGAGKTTLAKILANLYQPDSGTVRWDGADTAAFAPATVRDGVAISFQDFVRYRFSAADNIAVGRPERRADRDDIAVAADQAGARFVTGLPDGFDTRLGPEFLGGHDLSLGQWQRIALARAFFRDAPFIILDEPTASLDPRAERALFDDLRRLCDGRTVLLISHRLASVRTADRIYVLADGAVVEEGTHDELMSLAGQYADLFTLQATLYLDGLTNSTSSA